MLPHTLSYVHVLLVVTCDNTHRISPTMWHVPCAHSYVHKAWLHDGGCRFYLHLTNEESDSQYIQCWLHCTKVVSMTQVSKCRSNEASERERVLTLWAQWLGLPCANSQSFYSTIYSAMFTFHSLTSQTVLRIHHHPARPVIREEALTSGVPRTLAGRQVVVNIHRIFIKKLHVLTKYHTRSMFLDANGLVLQWSKTNS